MYKMSNLNDDWISFDRNNIDLYDIAKICFSNEIEEISSKE